MIPTRALLRTCFHRSPIRFASVHHCTRAMSTAESLAAEIAQQTTLVNELRLQNTDLTALDAAKKKLGELKKTLGAIGKAVESSVAAGTGDSKDGKKKDRLLLKTAKASPVDRRLVIDSRLTFERVVFFRPFFVSRVRGIMGLPRCSVGSTLRGSSRMSSRRMEGVVWTRPCLSARTY